MAGAACPKVPAVCKPWLVLIGCLSVSCSLTPTGESDPFADALTDDPPYDFTAGKTLGGLFQQKPVEACPGSTVLPDGCHRLGGTAASSANWLRCWQVNAVDPLNFGEISNYYFNSRCCLNAQAKQAVATTCLAASGLGNQIVCVGREVQTRLTNAELVCRHHAHCGKDVLALMKISANFEGGFIKADNEGGHAWLEVTAGDWRMAVDGYNDIHYSCPEARTAGELWRRSF